MVGRQQMCIILTITCFTCFTTEHFHLVKVCPSLICRSNLILRAVLNHCDHTFFLSFFYFFYFLYGILFVVEKVGGAAEYDVMHLGRLGPGYIMAAYSLSVSDHLLPVWFACYSLFCETHTSNIHNAVFTSDRSHY